MKKEMSGNLRDGMIAIGMPNYCTEKLSKMKKRRPERKLYLSSHIPPSFHFYPTSIL